MHKRLALVLILFASEVAEQKCNQFVVSCTEWNSISITCAHHFDAFHTDQQRNVPVNNTSMKKKYQTWLQCHQLQYSTTNFESNQLKLEEKVIKVIKSLKMLYNPFTKLQKLLIITYR
jgi:hypothetical protein